MITKIEEVNSFGKKINIIFTNVLNYSLQDDICILRYELRYRDPNRESVAIPDTVVANGQWEVPSNIINSWSGSNNYLAEQMAESFDLKVIEHLPN